MLSVNLAQAAAILTAIAALTGAILGFFNRKKIMEVHLLVNSRLDSTLNELTAVRQDLAAERQHTESLAASVASAAAAAAAAANAASVATAVVDPPGKEDNDDTG